MKFVGDLKGTHQTFVEQLVRLLSRDVFAMQQDSTRIGLDKACNDGEKCGFSGPVRSDQTGYRSFVDIKRASVNGMNTAKTLGYILDRDDRLTVGGTAKCGVRIQTQNCSPKRGYYLFVPHHLVKP